MANRPQQRGAKTKGGINPITLAILFVILVLVALPTVLIMFFGMLPTWVAAWVDRTRQKYAAFCVGGMNFIGVFPYILDMWSGANTPQAALKTLTNMFSLLAMFGSAALGWILFLLVPPVVAMFLQVVAERKVGQLRATQKRLVDEWGRAIASGDSAGDFDLETLEAPVRANR